MRALGLLLACYALVACSPLEVEPEPLVRPVEPLSIERAIEIALHNNPSVRISRQRVLQAGGTLDEASSAFWPDVTVGERFTRTNTPSRAFGNVLDQGGFTPGIDFNDPGTFSNFRTEATVGVTLYDGGRRRARLERVEAELGMHLATEVEIRNLIAFEVARAWLGVHAARTRAATSEQAVPQLAELLALVEAEAEIGALLPTEVEALRLQLARARLDAHAARDSGQRAETALGLLLGFGVEDRVTLAELPDHEPRSLEPLASELATARFARPELVRAQHAIEASVSALREVEAAALPELGLSAAFGFDDPDLALSRSNWFFGLGLVESLTELLRTPQRARRAAADVLVAHERGRASLLAVEDEVEAAWLDARAAERSLELARADDARVDRELKRAAAEFEVGAARRARFVRARLAADQARTALRLAELRRAVARHALDHATGLAPPPSDLAAR